MWKPPDEIGMGVFYGGTYTENSGNWHRPIQLIFPWWLAAIPFAPLPMVFAWKRVRKHYVKRRRKEAGLCRGGCLAWRWRFCRRFILLGQREGGG